MVWQGAEGRRWGNTGEEDAREGELWKEPENVGWAGPEEECCRNKATAESMVRGVRCYRKTKA